MLAAGSASLLGLFGDQAQVAQAAVVILIAARALEAVLGISVPVLQVIGKFRAQLTASIFGIIVAVGAGWLLIDHVDALTGVTLAMSIGLIVMSAIPTLQLAWGEKLHPFDERFPTVALRGIAITGVAGLVGLVIDRLPDAASIPLLILLAAAAIWCSLRFALPHADRASLGKVARRLRLVEPARP